MKKILALVLAVAMLLIPAGSALAAPPATGKVEITMTGGELAIGVYNVYTEVAATWAPTEPILTDTKYTSSPANAAYTLTNTGTVTINTTIKGNDMSATDGKSWTLSAGGTNVGTDYGMWYKKELDVTDTLITNSAVTFVNGIATLGTQHFGLSMLTPQQADRVTNGTKYTTTVDISAVQTP